MKAPPTTCNTPVLLIIWRRPELTRQAFEAIRAARPRQLWVAADGPRLGNPDDVRLCEETRKMVMRGIDWPCEVKTRFSAKNLGCKLAVSQAINWAFEECEKLIIIEDDCVAHADFFPFCDEMLDRYGHDLRVMQVCGSNLLQSPTSGSSYYFSRFGPVWGWATWRRAWECYDADMLSWRKQRNAVLAKCNLSPFEAQWRREVFDSVYEGRIDTWDYQWAYTKLLYDGLSIIPEKHLVSNIGFGADATHTHNADDFRACLPSSSLNWPLRHPQRVTLAVQNDKDYLGKLVRLPAHAWSLPGMKWQVKALVQTGSAYQYATTQTLRNAWELVSRSCAYLLGLSGRRSVIPSVRP